MQLKTLSLDRFIEFLSDGDTLPIEDAYEMVGWFQRAVNIRAEAVRSFPYDIIHRGKVEYSDNLIQSQDDTYDIIEKPDEIDIFNLLDDMVVDLDLFGAFYAIYETNRYNRNGAWRRLHPKSMKPVYDDIQGLKGFERTVNGKKIPYTLDELVYVWMPNRRSEVGHGKGVGFGALTAATSLNNIQKFQSAFFENGAINPTIVTIEDYDKYPQEEKDRVKNMFQRIMTGVKNAFKVIPVSGNTTVQSLIQNLNDMGMDNLTDKQRETIATTLGVPHSLLFSNATSFATATQDDLNFYDKTIVPLVEMIAWQLNERLFKPAGYILQFQKSRLEVYQYLETQKVDKLSMMLHDKVITISEYRQAMNMSPEKPVDEDEQAEAETDTVEDAITRLQSAQDAPTPPDVQEQAKFVEVVLAEDTDTQAQLDELGKWRKFASKRFKEGSPEKSLDFDTEFIPSTLTDSILRTLEKVNSIDSVHTVFNDAEAWISYA